MATDRSQAADLSQRHEPAVRTPNDDDESFDDIGDIEVLRVEKPNVRKHKAKEKSYVMPQDKQVEKKDVDEEVFEDDSD